jgi:glycosyltransferase involved in cell wall biosynthesis
VVVGVLTTSYPRHAGDFAGCFVEDHVRRLRRAGDAVHVIAAAAPGAARTPPPGARGLTVTEIPVDAGAAAPLFYGEGAPEALERRGAAAWLQALSFWGALCREVRAAAPCWDAMVSHWLVPCGLAAITAAPRALPHRAYAHSGDVALLERIPFGRTLARRLAASGAELVFVSADLRARFAALVDGGAGAGSFGRVEPLVPDPDLFAPATAAARAAARRRLGVTGRLVLAVGRLVPIKGFDLLVDACADLVTDLVADLVILGDGPARPALAARARQRGVRLRLPGVVPRFDLPTWLAAADVYAQPSRRLPSGRTEGLPMAALEALAVGVPVVASRSGGLAELGARGGDVTLVPAGDGAALAHALSGVLARTGLNLGRHADAAVLSS